MLFRSGRLAATPASERAVVVEEAPEGLFFLKRRVVAVAQRQRGA